MTLVPFYALIILTLTVSYLIGSLPTGYLLTKIIKGVDIRTQGSGNPGATNVFRVVGAKAGSLTLLIDFLKGTLPVLAAMRLTQSSANGFTLAGERPDVWLPAFAGAAAVCGHNWTIFLKFQGGKGVATSAGFFIALLPLPASIALTVFTGTLLLTRTVSLGSIAGSLGLLIATAFLNSSFFLLTLTGICAFSVIILHRKNILRLWRGEEPKISFTRRPANG